MVGVVDLRWPGAVGPAELPAVGDLGAPLAAAGHAVVATAAEELLVGVGAAAVGPVGRMVNLAAIAGFQVNRARQGTLGGEHKSDPKDAAVIADQVRTRNDLRALTQGRDDDVELRLLVGRRRDIVDDQTRRAVRLRDLPVSINPGLERVVDVTSKTGMWLLTR